jgi:hypothetical protein
MVEKKQTTIKNITEQAKLQLKDLTGFDTSSIVSIKKDIASTPGGSVTWIISVELLERRGIPDRMDILGIYEVKMDGGGNLISYERKGLRKRGDTAGQEVEEDNQ